MSYSHDDILGFISRKQFGGIAVSFGKILSLDTPFVFVQWRHVADNAGQDTGIIHPTESAPTTKALHDIEVALIEGDDIGPLVPEDITDGALMGHYRVQSWPFQHRGVAVFQVPGANEGAYVHVEIIHPNDARSHVALIKYLHADDAERAVTLLARKFNSGL